MQQTEQNKDFELLKEKYSRHEKILIQAYKSIKQKEQQLKELYEEQKASKEELHVVNEELLNTNEELIEKSEIISEQNEELQTALQHLRETQSQLLQSEKMASLGILTAGVAHEINNPLNFIMGGVIGLENYFEDYNCQQPEKIHDLLSKVKTGINRITDIIRGLDQFSSVNENDPQPCDMHSIVNNCLVILQNQFKNRIEIRKDYTKEKITIKGNVGELHQAIINILNNSIQSIEAEGKISITTEKKHKDLIIEISDTGCGISKENLPKITDPFFTSKDPGKGVGLGLSIAYTIIQEHKGKLDFKSESGKGTRVKITFPLSMGISDNDSKKSKD